jgi:hypothetical protein
MTGATAANTPLPAWKEMDTGSGVEKMGRSKSKQNHPRRNRYKASDLIGFDDDAFLMLAQRTLKGTTLLSESLGLNAHERH